MELDKIHEFIKGLRPEFVVPVQSAMPQIVEEAMEKAQALETAFSMGMNLSVYSMMPGYLQNMNGGMISVRTNLAIIYLSKQLQKDKTMYNLWQVAGGKVENRETSLQAVLKETKEETALDIKKDECIFYSTIQLLIVIEEPAYLNQKERAKEALYGEAIVYGQPVNVLIDSGAVGMVQQVPVQMRNIKVYVNMIVTNSAKYNVLLGNEWLKKEYHPGYLEYIKQQSHNSTGVINSKGPGKCLWNENSKTISQLHKKLIQEITPQLGIHILSISSDGAITEFQAQQSIIDIQTPQRLSIHELSLNIHFSCPIFDNIGPIVWVQDLKHAKKTARNAIFSGAWLLTFGTSSV
ncbi:hypothetical protein RhiirA1_500421 [Rhizophagus irregularis]|uniref:Nudix hydrolase domain-containing protein n=1 Tax=Rhizophagus irregularis TaxID=588596 RepID=A0A2N0QZX8_9GLOM|nr:hypothetical protein RhiirA1_500421 [Rhizophagus irregularis]